MQTKIHVLSLFSALKQKYTAKFECRILNNKKQHF